VRRWLISLAGIGALAGCGSTSTTTSTTTATSATTPVTTTTTTTTTTTRAASSATGTASVQAASSACPSGRISVTAGGGGAGLGHVGIVLRFRSTASAVCVLSGYPGATFVTSAGHDVPARRTRNGYLGGLAGASAPIPVVRVAPGQTVSALLEGSDSDPADGGGPCPRYASLLVTPPNQTVTARMVSPLASICRPEVHPVVAGTTGRASG
jgi:hypothetical protein